MTCIEAVLSTRAAIGGELASRPLLLWDVQWTYYYCVSLSPLAVLLLLPFIHTCIVSVNKGGYHCDMFPRYLRGAQTL